MIQNIRVGVPVIGGSHWLGGVSYVESLVRGVTSLPRSERPTMFLIAGDADLPSLPLHEPFLYLFDGIIYSGSNLPAMLTQCRREFLHYPSACELEKEIDFLFPVNCDVLPGRCSGSWIPDFQHIHLSEFFSSEELESRSRAFSKIASKARLIVLSSRQTQEDFHRLYSDSQAALRVLSFHAQPDSKVFGQDPVQVQKKYHLPDRFLICCNQFWKHKNHLLLLEAVRGLIQKGCDLQLVCTGSTTDYRQPDYFPQIRNFISESGLSEYVTILGTVPRQDQLCLLRRAEVLIQPSLFEGWSTVVEDGRALGKTMILSDLPVHLEQSPAHAVYFRRNDPDHLASVIEGLLPELMPGPDLVREQSAREESRQLTEHFARTFCSIAMEAHFLHGRKVRGMSETLWRILCDAPTADRTAQVTSI